MIMVNASECETFEQWALLHNAALFVNLVAYVDESGTHDPTGGLPGSDVVTVAGLVSTKEDWIHFDSKWRSILKKYGAEYFHFREWSDALLVLRKKRKPSSEFRRNQYREWSEDTLTRFLIELANIASSRMIVGGYVPTALYHNDRLNGVVSGPSPHALCLDHLFKSVVSSVNEWHRAWRKKPVSFTFDHSENKAWRSSILEQFYSNQKLWPHFVEIGFHDKKDHTPLQAADMLAYRLRQSMSNFANADWGRKWPELDGVLFKQFHTNWKTISKAKKDRMFLRVFSVTTK